MAARRLDRVALDSWSSVSGKTVMRNWALICWRKTITEFHICSANILNKSIVAAVLRAGIYDRVRSL